LGSEAPYVFFSWQVSPIFFEASSDVLVKPAEYSVFTLSLMEITCRPPPPEHACDSASHPFPIPWAGTGPFSLLWEVGSGVFSICLQALANPQASFFQSSFLQGRGGFVFFCDYPRLGCPISRTPWTKAPALAPVRELFSPPFGWNLIFALPLPVKFLFWVPETMRCSFPDEFKQLLTKPPLFFSSP